MNDERGMMRPFGEYEVMDDLRLTGSFAGAPQHPVWKGFVQLASEVFMQLQGVIDDPAYDARTAERAIGGQLALRALMEECDSRTGSGE